MKLNQIKNQTFYIFFFHCSFLMSGSCSSPKVTIPKETELGKNIQNQMKKIAKRTLELTLNSIKRIQRMA